MQSFEQQLRHIEKRLDRAAKFGEINKKEFRKANRQSAKSIVLSTRSNLKPYKEDITIHFEGRENIDVKRDQLRKSIGVWFGKGSNTAFVGPRANRAGKRKLQRKVRENADGWFAHIVEMGARPATMRKGGKKGGKGVIMNTPMKGKLSQGLQNGIPQARQKQIELYRKEFERFMR
jgi:hypothetical protein